MTQDDQIFAELAYLGRTVHWSFGELLDLEHHLRRRLIAVLAASDE